MKKSIETKVGPIKGHLQVEDGKILANETSFTGFLNESIQGLGEKFEKLDVDDVDKISELISDVGNASMIAAGELSAETFKSDDELDDMDFEANIGKNIELSAHFSRKKTHRNPKTGDDVIVHNEMSRQRLTIRGVGSSAARKRAKEYGAELLG